MRVLVTGAAGFIGSHLAETLLSRGDAVVGLDDFNAYYDPAVKRANVATLVRHRQFTLREGDVRDSETLLDVCSGGFDAIAHLAAMAGVRYSIEHAPLYVDVNVRGTVNVLDAARATGIGHIVLASTSSVYGATDRMPFREDDPLGRPLAPYPASKIGAELMGHAYHNLFGLSFTALRFFSVYGPRGRPDMMPYKVMDCIYQDIPFPLYEGGEMFRDWTYVADIVAGIVTALDRPLGYQCINLGRGEPVRMADFVEKIEALVGRPAHITTPSAPASEPRVTFADISKARELLGYSPTTSVEEGLCLQWHWYQKHVGSGA
ncbi:MAG: NAD-dependent epimerase/dehydratase family protein [Chloroflexi bacterium]|nr:NAD-dependent epimerase/dehydratase family protein [Chloroflexota bacterium]